jgi:F-type H+-transporting ATPase subunit delta
MLRGAGLLIGLALIVGCVSMPEGGRPLGRTGYGSGSFALENSNREAGILRFGDSLRMSSSPSDLALRPFTTYHFAHIVRSHADFYQKTALPFHGPDVYFLGIINHIFKVGFDVLTHQFILFLSEKNRLNILKDICDVFEQTYLDSHNILKITITSSIALNDRQTVDIAEQLRRKFGKEIEMSATVDPSLIGGIKIRQGNTIFDYSFNAQLERFRANLIKA